MANFDPRGSKTPERILMKPKIYNCVAGMTTHANACGAATTWVVSANTWHVTCFGFSDDFFSFLYSWDRLRHRPLTDFDDLPRNDVPFGGPVVAIHHLGDQIHQKLQFGGVYRLFGLTRKILKPAYYQNYCIDSNQILHDTKDHQVLKYGPPKNPRWRLPHLENHKNRDITVTD